MDAAIGLAGAETGFRRRARGATAGYRRVALATALASRA